MTDQQPSPSPRPPDHNRTGVDFRRPWPRPPVPQPAIDFHLHLLAARQAPLLLEVAAHYGFTHLVSMTPLEEAIRIQRQFGPRIQFIAIPQWQDSAAFPMDNWLRRVEAFHNLGSRICKFHMAPGMMHMRQWRLDSPAVQRIMREAADRGMLIMTHVGDPDTWYSTRYSDSAKFGTREDHYRMWEDALEQYRDHPWLGAHLGGNPEDLPRLQNLLDRFPNLYLDCSATRWLAREVSARRDAAREFFIRNQTRIIFGSDQVTGDDRGWDFLASRYWVHRKLWETAYAGPSPIFDPDLPEDHQPPIRGLALPTEVLARIYHTNAIALLKHIGVDLLAALAA